MLSSLLARRRWRKAAAEMVAELSLPFVPLRLAEDPNITIDGVKMVQAIFRCTKLGADGRCTIYETRPQLCRTYEAGSDPLCVEHKAFKGIPITTAPATPASPT